MGLGDRPSAICAAICAAIRSAIYSADSGQVYFFFHPAMTDETRTGFHFVTK